ncbi:IS110 family transposase, partial [Thiohalocapsa halophila]
MQSMLEAAGPALMVLDPNAAKRFAEAPVRRQKTDPVDAGVLAQFAERMPFTPWRRPADEVPALRACARQASRRDAAPTEHRAPWER